MNIKRREIIDEAKSYIQTKGESRVKSLDEIEAAVVAAKTLNWQVTLEPESVLAMVLYIRAAEERSHDDLRIAKLYLRLPAKGMEAWTNKQINRFISTGEKPEDDEPKGE